MKLTLLAFSLLGFSGIAAAQSPAPVYGPQPGYAPVYNPQPTYQPEPTPARQGFYIGFSMGAGGLQFKEQVNGDEVESDRENSFAFTILRLGGAVTERLLLGANLGGWGKQYENSLLGDVSATLIRINFEATYYPILNPRGVDMFLRAGIGSAQYQIKEIEGRERSLIKEKGAALQVGLGIEKKLLTSFALGASLDWHFAKLDNDVEANYWEAAVQFTWY